MNEGRLRDRFLGALLGTAVGDSLGASREGGPMAGPELIAELLEASFPLIYTDDTHMTLGLAQSLVECQGFNGSHMAQTFVRNFDAEPWRGYGAGPPRVFALIKGGRPWNEASSLLYAEGSYGNGAAMRAAPIGLLYHTNPALLREVAYQSSLITHAHPLGKEGAAIQAYSVALAIQTCSLTPLDRSTFLAKLASYTQNNAYQQKLRIVGELLKDDDRARVIKELGHGVEALNSVPTAIYCFLAHNPSFAEAVAYAVSLGGDADTIAAMTGAISGAYWGFGAIPQDWLERLENRELIEEWGERLWHLSVQLGQGYKEGPSSKG